MAEKQTNMHPNCNVLTKNDHHITFSVLCKTKITDPAFTLLAYHFTELRLIYYKCKSSIFSFIQQWSQTFSPQTGLYFHGRPVWANFKKITFIFILCKLAAAGLMNQIYYLYFRFYVGIIEIWYTVDLPLTHNCQCQAEKNWTPTDF